MNMILVSEDALDSIKRMAQEDAKDAARYRWLRELATKREDHLYCVVENWSHDSNDAYALDESIDMQAKP